MDKWADYLISKVSYDSDHLISVAIRHQDTEQGITEGKPIDRLTIASDIKNGLLYITIYNGKNSWKKGHKIKTFSISGTPYLRIDGNKVKLDYLGDIQELLIPEYDFSEQLESHQEPITEPEEEATPEQLARLEQLEKQIEQLESHQEPITEPETLPSPRGSLPKDSTEELPQELDLAPEPITEPETLPSPRGSLPKDSTEELPQELDLAPEPITEPETLPSPRGSLPKDSTEELPQELDLAPEPITEPEEEEATPEQLARLEQLEKQIEQLESHQEPITEPEEEEATQEQLTQLNDLQQQIDELENILSSNLNLSSGKSSKQIPKIKKSKKPEDTNIEQKIIRTLQKQNQKLDNIEKKLHNSTIEKTLESNSLDAYCVKCKTKRNIENPEETVMKNGRPAIRGICAVCKCKVFRIIKTKKN
ncbi:DUF5679 domain-containing protein [Nitrosopumilus sp.]|uniref:DUF5679 domain-containing protein n=1 Tax=Nitrosopumilus sp. TaxID=2024843 RepID=UPI0026200DC1|nr:DUF5679 domain-containing protein [Nitrosopumilus sp.]